MCASIESAPTSVFTACRTVKATSLWARLTKTVQFKFEIVKNEVNCRRMYDTNLSSTTLSSKHFQTKRRWANVHTCSVHYNTCHMFRMMIRHGCYSALLASYLELRDRRV